MEKTNIKVIIETEDGKHSLKSEYGLENVTNIEPKVLRSLAITWLDFIENEDKAKDSELMEFIQGLCGFQPLKTEVIDLTNGETPKVRMISVDELNDMINHQGGFTWKRKG